MTQFRFAMFDKDGNHIGWSVIHSLQCVCISCAAAKARKLADLLPVPPVRLLLHSVDTQLGIHHPN